MIGHGTELPEGWKLSTLADTATLVKNKVDPLQMPDVTYVGLEHVEAHTMRIVGCGRGSDVKSTKTKFSAGDVLYGKLRPYLNKVARPDFDGISSTDFLVFKESPTLDPGYLANYLNQLWVAERAHHLSNGVELPRVDWQSLSQLPIAYPDNKDQQRVIVGQLDAVRHLQSSAHAHIDAARRAIESFRQTVLAAACSGRLTADWREQSEDSSAALLIEGLHEAVACRKKVITEPDPELADELPRGWELVTLGLLVERIEAGKSFAVHGRQAMEHEWGVIKVSAMSWGQFLANQNKAVPEGRPINPSYEIKPGDLLISRANTVDLVGATVLVGATRPRLLLSDKSLRLVPHCGIDKAWLNYTLRSRFVRSQFSERATGTSDSMRNLSQEKILATTLPLPPTAEQQEIARRVDALLIIADRVQARVAQASQRADRISQAVLAKALRGELLPEEGSR